MTLLSEFPQEPKEPLMSSDEFEFDEDGPIKQALDVSLKAVFSEHSICMMVPHGACLEGAEINLPGGLLIYGTVIGKVTCAEGSLIIGEGGRLEGHAEAADFICEGEVTSPVDTSGKVTTRTISTIVARGSGKAGHLQTGGIAALSSLAKVTARIKARAFQVPQGANLGRVIMQRLD
jgi:hypothetical protein